MVFSNEEKVILKSFRIKYKYGATRIFNNYPEYEQNVNGLKKLLKKVDETGDVARKESSRWPKSVRIEKNIKHVEEMIISQEDQPGPHSTTKEMARELSIDCQSVSRIIDQDVNFRPLRERKVQILTDSNIEKRMIHSRKLMLKYTQETLQTPFFSDKKVFKVTL